MVLFSTLGTFRQLTVVQESKVVSERFPTVAFFLVIFSQCHAHQRSGATTNTVEPLLLFSSVESTAQIYIEMLNSVIVAALWLNAHDELDV